MDFFGIWSPKLGAVLAKPSKFTSFCGIISYCLQIDMLSYTVPEVRRFNKNSRWLQLPCCISPEVVMRVKCDIERCPTSKDQICFKYLATPETKGCLDIYDCGHPTCQRLHRVSKNVPPLTCYNLDIHGPIAVIFRRSVTEKVGNQTLLCLLTSPI